MIIRKTNQLFIHVVTDANYFFIVKMSIREVTVYLNEN